MLQFGDTRLVELPSVIRKRNRGCITVSLNNIFENLSGTAGRISTRLYLLTCRGGSRRDSRGGGTHTGGGIVIWGLFVKPSFLKV